MTNEEKEKLAEIISSAVSSDISESLTKARILVKRILYKLPFKKWKNSDGHWLAEVTVFLQASFSSEECHKDHFSDAYGSDDGMRGSYSYYTNHHKIDGGDLSFSSGLWKSPNGAVMQFFDSKDLLKYSFEL